MPFLRRLQTITVLAALLAVAAPAQAADATDCTNIFCELGHLGDARPTAEAEESLGRLGLHRHTTDVAEEECGLLCRGLGGSPPPPGSTNGPVVGQHSSGR